MQNLTRAHNELFRRTPDERFSSLDALWRHCEEEKKRSLEQWYPPALFRPRADGHTLTLEHDQDGPFRLNDWSFSQLCQAAKVSKDTVNKLSAPTAAAVLDETFPRDTRPVQVFVRGENIRSIQGTSYKRLFNADLLSMLIEFATDFQAPQEAMDGGTGFYCGEQDMFCFLIDPTGWAEIEGEAFAPGFFLWNSEVGKRSLGIQTFWFQAVCQNHIVWDAVEVCEFTRKHTANVYESMSEIRRMVEKLVEKRDERRDGFTNVIRKAMQEKLGSDAEEVLKVLTKQGIPRGLGQQATEIAKTEGRFTIFSLVDALTRLSGQLPNAGDRTEADNKAAKLLALAA